MRLKTPREQLNPNYHNVQRLTGLTHPDEVQLQVPLRPKASGECCSYTEDTFIVGTTLLFQTVSIHTHFYFLT